MDIRLLNITDAEKYWSLRLEALQENPDSFAQSYEEAKDRKNPIEGVAKNISNDDNFTFGAFQDDELVGVITLLQNSAAKLRHRSNILGMYVTPQMRGKGVGGSLLINAIQKAKSVETIEKINLTVAVSNFSAKKLYGKLGFKSFGTEKKALKIGNEYYDEEFMTLFLNN